MYDGKHLIVTPITIVTGTNRLASLTTPAGTRSIAYDVRGNPLSETRPAGQNVTLGYDGYGRLTSYARDGEASLTHSYNGNDDRISTTTISAATATPDTRRFIYDPDGRVLGGVADERAKRGQYGSNASDVRAEFIWMSPQVGANDNSQFGGDDGLGGYMPLAVAANDNIAGPGATQLLWVHANHMGVPAVYTNASGAQVAAPTGYSAPGFPGQNQTLSDLYYNRHRDYDPTTGRYIQADPIGLEGDKNPYLYAGANPLGVIDPQGLRGFFGGFSKGPRRVKRLRKVKRTTKPRRRQENCPEASPPPPPVDWCGSKGSEWVPDGNWGAACKNHDSCYSRLGASKERCDGQLTLEIAAECTENSSIIGLPLCGIVGGIYGGTLAGVGLVPGSPPRRAYNNAQNRR